MTGMLQFLPAEFIPVLLNASISIAGIIVVNACQAPSTKMQAFVNNM